MSTLWQRQPFFLEISMPTHWHKVIFSSLTVNAKFLLENNRCHHFFKSDNFLSIIDFVSHNL